MWQESNSATETLVIRQAEQTSSEEILELTSSEGAVFFVRSSYLQNLKIDEIFSRVSESKFPGAEFSAEESADILRSAFALSAEKKALDLLGRCEQNRFGLGQKLVQRGFSRDSVQLALDRLESKNYLNDSRFAKIWVRSHCATKFHGKSRVLSELLQRGIGRQTALEAVEEYFSGEDGKVEENLCRKALEKAVRQNKSGEKLLKFLLDSGFPYKMVQRMAKNR